MNQLKLKRSLSGLALLMGLFTGMTLAIAPDFAPGFSPSTAVATGEAAPVSLSEDGNDNSARLPMICTLSCRFCSHTVACPPGEGTCAETTCVNLD
ncbi:hypothetical protein JY651_18440 [Pyxidicoccus parkwayensis]|jgi:hypothetical protein|uniref:Uncharacterized protein n=1 Tax=Pyxidicoccus parkwayensis TaxID=2813578 RepID=A0ABX7P8I9_9BACT|nr:hypothetical protein [Pyxidicoccus parkwaysis]QSQ26778.1 hypothetical protein JY651_18440 [Pyxidicoccus parkwaysis]